MALRTTIGYTTFHVGDTIGVHYKLIEKEKVAGRAKREVHEKVRERIQIFRGIVLAIKGSGDNQMFTVRRIAKAGIGVERIFPVISPWIKKITVYKQAKVKRAKLYYLREKVGKQTMQLKEKVKTTQKSQAKKRLPLSKKLQKKSSEKSDQ